jgi:hypothetical protein
MKRSDVLAPLSRDHHVRFEERELFSLLEERLQPDDLARLGEAIEAHA